MDFLMILNKIVSVSYYLIALFFLVAIIRTFLKTKNIQNALTYCIMMIPFLLRILRIK